MSNKTVNIVMKIVTTLMEIPKEDYSRCKEELFKKEYYLDGDITTEWLKICFRLIEEHRPELQKGGVI